MPSTDAEEATGADDQPKYMETTSVTEVQCLEELTRLLQNCLESDVEETPLENQDPFLALKNVDRLAESIAERMAPKPSSQPGATKRSFRFPGHRRLCREIDIFEHARQLVHKVVGQSSEIMHCHQTCEMISKIETNKEYNSFRAPGLVDFSW